MDEQNDKDLCENNEEMATTKATLPKRKQSEAQKANTIKMREKLALKHESIRAEKSKLAEEKKKLKEERIVKKALHIKKKEIKEAQELAISDSDSEIEVPKEKEKVITKALNPKPKLSRKKIIKTPEQSEEEQDEETPIYHTPLARHLKRNFPFIVTYI